MIARRRGSTSPLDATIQPTEPGPALSGATGDNAFGRDLHVSVRHPINSHRFCRPLRGLRERTWLLTGEASHADVRSRRSQRRCSKIGSIACLSTPSTWRGYAPGSACNTSLLRVISTKRAIKMARSKLSKLLFTIAILICTASASLSILAQTIEPRQIDEFGKLSDGALQAHLDNVLNYLNQNQNASAQFLIGRGEKLPIGTAQRHFGIMREYLIYQKVDPSRIISTMCKPQPDENIQVWLVSTLGERKACEPDIVRIDETVLFDVAPGSDNYSFASSRVEEIRIDSLDLALDSYAEQLRSAPSAKGYVLIYGGTNVFWSGDLKGGRRTVRKPDSKARIRGMTVKTVETLKKKGLQRNQFVIRESGYRDSSAQIELWIVPSGGEKPTPSRTYPKVKVSED